MILKEWLLRTGMSQRELSRKLGINHNHLCQVINGKKRGSSKLAFAIKEITKGSVTVEDFLFPEKQEAIIPITGKK